MNRYNARAYHAPYGRHQEWIAGGDLTNLEVVVREDYVRSESFSFKVLGGVSLSGNI